MERPAVLHVIFFDSVGLVTSALETYLCFCHMRGISKMETEHGDMVGDLPLMIGDA